MNKSTHIVVDFSNLMFRARYGCEKNTEVDDIAALSVNTAFSMISKAFKSFNATHLVLAFDQGTSWRKRVYPLYKMNRRIDVDPIDVHIRKCIYKSIDDIYEVFEKSAATLLKAESVEADDFISKWTEMHPETQHIILSSDSDLIQLVSDTVYMFNGMANELWTPEGVFYEDGLKSRKGQEHGIFFNRRWKKKFDKKSNDQYIEVDTSWIKFEKIMRGDVSDNIPRALPKGYRTKKLMEAYKAGKDSTEYRILMGTQIKEEEKTVRDRFNENRELIDLDCIPDDILDKIAYAIAYSFERTPKPELHRHFTEFCRKHNLPRLLQNFNYHIDMLMSRYDGHLAEHL